MTRYPTLVYGTLRPGGTNYNAFLNGHTVFEQNVQLDGFTMLAGGGFPYLTDGDRTITATLVYVKEEDYNLVLNQLDWLEGYDSEGNPRNHYDRRLHTFTHEGVEFSAWIYVASAATAEAVSVTLPVLESGDWVAHYQEKLRARTYVTK